MACATSSTFPPQIHNININSKLNRKSVWQHFPPAILQYEWMYNIMIIITIWRRLLLSIIIYLSIVKQLFILLITDVWNSNFISVPFWKKTLILFGMSLVRFEKTWFGSAIVVIYYLCNSWVVNLQQILQHYCAVLNELCIPYAKLSFGHVFKHSLSAR